MYVKTLKETFTHFTLEEGILFDLNKEELGH